MIIIIILLATRIKFLMVFFTFSFWQNFLFSTEWWRRKNKNELKEKVLEKRTANISFINVLLHFFS